MLSAVVLSAVVLSAVVLSRWLVPGMRHMAAAHVTAPVAIVHDSPYAWQYGKCHTRAANVNAMSLPHSYRQAFALATNEAERAFLAGQIAM